MLPNHYPRNRFNFQNINVAESPQTQSASQQLKSQNFPAIANGRRSTIPQIRRSPKNAMSTPSGSLEDCHTNVFALTELSGLKWKRLTTAENFQYNASDIDQDPILRAHAQCMQANVLCTWRRRAANPPPESGIHSLPLRLDTPKELWIFWYANEEPDLVARLLNDGLIADNDDSELVDAGAQPITYETRTQFFKALHNVFERNMLKSGYIRFGRWFTRPLDERRVGAECALPAYTTALRFEFVVQGENHVCATVKTQCQPPILRLTQRHLRSRDKVSVILGPWSIRALLVADQPLQESGEPLSEEVQQCIAKNWEEWKRSVTLPDISATHPDEEDCPMDDQENCRNPDAEKLPKFVLVEVDGIRLFYPSSLIGIVSTDPTHSSAPVGKPDVEESPEDPLVGVAAPSRLTLLEQRNQRNAKSKKDANFVPEPLRHSRKSFVGVRVGRRSFEDSCIAVPPVPPIAAPAGGLHLQMPSTSAATPQDLMWNYFDYLRKEYCYCRTCSAQPAPNDEKPSVSALNPPTTCFHRIDESARSDPSANFSTKIDPGPVGPELEFLSQPPKHDDDSEMGRFARTRTLDISSRLEPQAAGGDVGHSTDLADFAKFAESRQSQQRAEWSGSYQPFTPITCVTPDAELDDFFIKDGNNILSEKLRDFDYPYNPVKVDHDYHPTEPYHTKGRRKKPTGPPLRRRRSPASKLSAPVAGSSARASVLRSLLNDEEENDQDPVQQVTPLHALSPHSTNRVEEEWAQRIGAALLRRPKHRNRMSRFVAAASGRDFYTDSREFVERPPVAATSSRFARDSVGSVANTPSATQSAAGTPMGGVSTHRDSIAAAFSVDGGSNGPHSNASRTAGGLIDDLRSPPSKRRNLRADSESAMTPDVGPTSVGGPHSSQWSRGGQRIRDRSPTIGDESPNFGDPLNPESTVFARRKALERRLQGRKTPPLNTAEPEEPKVISKIVEILDSSDDEAEPDDPKGSGMLVARSVDSDLLCPKTPTNGQTIHSTATSTFAAVAAAPNDSHPQMFTSQQTLESTVQGMLSPPASNERVDSAAAASSTTALASTAAASQPTPQTQQQISQLPPQSLTNLGTVVLHSASWNTLNTANDSLSVIYPTPPTPMQQFSPQNLQLLSNAAQPAIPVKAEEEPMETSDGETDRIPFKRSEFLDSEKTASKLVLSPHSPVYPHPGGLSLMLSDCYAGDLLDERIEPKRRVKALRHLKHEPDAHRRQMKHDLKHRSRRSFSALPPDYVLFMHKQAKHHLDCTTMAPYGHPDDLAMNAVSFVGHRKPIGSYGIPAAVRLHNIAAKRMDPHHPNHDFQRQQSMSAQNEGLFRTPSGVFHMGGPNQMFYGGRPPAYHPQQQMMGMHGNGASGPHMVGPPMPMGAVRPQQPYGGGYGGPPGGPYPQYGPNGQIIGPPMPGGGYPPRLNFSGGNNPQMPNGYPNGQFGPNGAPMTPQQQQQYLHQQMMMQRGSPMDAAQIKRYPPHIQQQLSQNPFGGFGNTASTPSPMSSDHNMGMSAGGPHSLPQQPPNPGNHPAPSPFGSPAPQQQPIGSVGTHSNTMGRTPAGADTLPISNSVMSAEASYSGVVATRSLHQQLRIDETLRIFAAVKSRVITVLMRDTIFDLYYDTVFDACPICSCNANIRSSELGLYIQSGADILQIDNIRQRQLQDKTFMPDYWSGLMHPVAGPGSCTCGFSAVRHRYLCTRENGLFPDDYREAAGSMDIRVAGDRLKPIPPAIMGDIVNSIRMLALSRDFSIAYRLGYYLGELPERFDGRRDDRLDSHRDYIVPNVEADEFNVALTAALEVATGAPRSNAANLNAFRKSLYHSWGFQMANGIREPKDQECLAVVKEIHSVLERSIREVRGVEVQANIVEGPLTWRSFVRKAVKSAQEDESYRPEQIPQILVSAERDPISTNPQLIHMWEKLTMGPYDQPKDILYLVVCPDSNVIVDKCRVFMEELSSLYEKCRFGRHVRLMGKQMPRDGIIRVNLKGFQDNSHSQAAHSRVTEEERNHFRKVEAFCTVIDSELKPILHSNEGIYDRRTYYETLYRYSHVTQHTSLAANSDSTSMPPPQAPANVVPSPSSVLSTASGGPASQPPASYGGHLSAANALNQPITTPPTAGLFQQQNQSPVVVPNPHPLNPSDSIEPLRTPEVSIGTPGSAGDSTTSAATASQGPQPFQPSDEDVAKNVDEYLTEDHPLQLPHMIVVYVVNPFAFGSETFSSKIAHFVDIAFTKGFNALINDLDPKRRPQVQLEMLSLQTLFDYTGFVADPLREDRQTLESVEMLNRDKPSTYDCLRRVAFSVYSQMRLLMPQHVRGALPDSMTRFGPAAAMSDVLDDMRRRDASQLFFKVPTMPFVLAPIETIGPEAKAIRSPSANPNERVLFVSYCLCNDEILFAAVTDQYGHLADNVVINLHVDQQSQVRYKNKSQIIDAIQRLWLYIQGILVLETRNWRLVISRVGKIGHGEFKVWSQILSKNSLKHFNSNFKGRDKAEGMQSAGLGTANLANCRTCAATANAQELPIILSACLLSLEAEPHIRLFSSSIAQADAATTKSSKAAKNGVISLLEDPSITHIIAFPTSPEISTDPLNNQMGIEDDGLFGDVGVLDELKLEGDEEWHSLMDDAFGDMKSEQPIDHQPIATGYIVSTAAATELPEWFWSTCPSVRRHLPVHLKNALHINSSNVPEDVSIAKEKGNAEAAHPLDEQASDVVLKHVMRMHNALSWLNVDAANGTRQSCLPVHMQSLMRLYRTFEMVCFTRDQRHHQMNVAEPRRFMSQRPEHPYC